MADIILNSAGHQFIDEEEVRDFVLELAANEKEVEEIVDWLRTTTKMVSEGKPARQVQKVFPPLTEKTPERLLKKEIRPKYESLMLKTTQRFGEILRQLAEMCWFVIFLVVWVYLVMGFWVVIGL